MAPPNLLSNSSMYSAEPVQIISKPGLQPEVHAGPKPQRKTTPPKYQWQIVWRNVFIFIYLHFAAFYGIYYIFTGAMMGKSVAWFFFTTVFAATGVTGGAHRLWAHRAYKAKTPLRIWLCFWQTVALQNHVYEWVRDHRVHHKFCDSDADPHNASRGFFFSHMGWLLVKKHKDVFIKGKTVDMSDLDADPVVMFQKKYYKILAPICCFFFPTVVPWYFWNENISVAWHFNALFRYVLQLHVTWLVNSAAHMYGFRPYEKDIKATDSKTVGWMAMGEGWHNYHHVFPWDYKAAELGNYRMNLTTAFLDFYAKVGLAYDLKTVSLDMINKRAKRTGDGTRKHPLADQTIEEIVDQYSQIEHVWGWDDKDMKPEQRQMVNIINPEHPKAA